MTHSFPTRRSSDLSIYFITQTGGAALGQLLLGIPDPAGNLLFAIVSVLISLSLVPMLLSAGPSPAFEAPARLSLRRLFGLSPLGLSRSEEHTSELQSLMRISYAVFCLKKKT